MQDCRSNGCLKGLKTTMWGAKGSIRHSGSSPSHCTYAFRVPKRNTRKKDLVDLSHPRQHGRAVQGAPYHTLAVWLDQLVVVLIHTRHLLLKWNLQKVTRKCQPQRDPLLTSGSQLSPACFVFLFPSSWVSMAGTAQWLALWIAPQL